ncbi:type II and III secretion system protein family protein [Xanthobacter sp. TB0139]|uniref:type II and III secretion system protein family protein n=1 Tax=Xanthobacter sp. TB0139 TaxID=3459178 RepID=UPI0040396756
MVRLTGALRFVAVVCALMLSALPQARANGFGDGEKSSTFSVPMHQIVNIGVGRSRVIELSEPARDTYVADSEVASAVMQTRQRLVITGLKDGDTTILVNAADGRPLASVEVRVARDMGQLQSTLQTALPHSNITARAAGDAIILTGTVQAAADAARAVDIAAGFAGNPDKVVNAITLNARDQVMLKVSVAEVQRNVLKQFGVNANGSWAVGDIIMGGVMNNPYGVAGQALTSTVGAIAGSSVNPAGGTNTLTLHAMAQTGVARMLAEPTLTAASGETATFLVGGEVPVPTGMTCSSTNTCQPTIEFKKFGVTLTFTPVVLSAGRISLRIATEVSEPDTQNQLSFSTGTSTLSIPGFRVRKQQTVVELPSGGTLVTAGLIQESGQQAITGIPGAMDVPILGTLFRSRDYQRLETELVITVTPMLARPLEARQVTRPDQGFADAPDPRAVFLGQVNRIIGSPRHKVDPSQFYGHAGFILD